MSDATYLKASKCKRLECCTYNEETVTEHTWSNGKDTDCNIYVYERDVDVEAGLPIGAVVAIFIRSMAVAEVGGFSIFWFMIASL